jgi:hypothetical protein
MVSNVPVSSRMMNEYSAISPSRNDQWSGNTFRSALLANLAAPNRSSIPRAAESAGPPRDIPSVQKNQDLFTERTVVPPPFSAASAAL